MNSINFFNDKKRPEDIIVALVNLTEGRTFYFFNLIFEQVLFIM